MFNKNGVSTYTYRWRDQDGNNDYTPGEVNLTLNGADFLTVSGPANNITNLDLKIGKTADTTPSIERELLQNMSFRALWLFKEVFEELSASRIVNVLRPY